MGKKKYQQIGCCLAYSISQNFDLRTISQLIKAGANVNYISYKNENKIVEYRPILYQALQISDDEKRKAVLKVLLERNVNLDAQYVQIDYRYGMSKNVEGVKTEEVKNLQDEIDAERKEKAENSRQIVKAFLRNEIGLTEEQEIQLVKNLSDMNIDIYSWCVEGDLKNKKIIFDCFGVTKQAFSIYFKSLSQPLNVLYARAKFFCEEGIRVKPSNYIYTLGTNKLAFAEKYGEKIIKRETHDKTQYAGIVKKELVRKYRLPMTQEEFEKSVKEIKNEERGIEGC